MAGLRKYADATVASHYKGVPLIDRSLWTIEVLNGGYSILSIDPGFHLGASFTSHSNAFRFVPLENDAVGASASSKGTSQKDLTRIIGNSFSV